MNYIPKLEDFMKAWEDNRVFKCENEHFVGFKYNICTVYNADWDAITLSARGIAFDKETGECVAYPFTKFFNYQELICQDGTEQDLMAKVKQYDIVPNFGMKFRVMDKLDGSLGIAFYDKYADKWQVKTGGSFESDQAVWATQWLNDHVQCNALMNRNYTYCFEIIYDADIHPINYNFEGLVLLGILDRTLYRELPLAIVQTEAQKLKLRVAESIEFNTFNDVIPYATSLPNTKEGVVVTFIDNMGNTHFKVKLKGKEFLELQRAFHAITPEEIWNHLDPQTGLVDKDYVQSIPEEMPDMKAFAKQLEEDFRKNENRVKTFIYNIKSDTPRVDVYRKVAEEFKEDPALINGSMKMYTALLNNADFSYQLNISIAKSIKP